MDCLDLEMVPKIRALFDFILNLGTIMNPFIKLKQASQYSENDTYLLNINHVVRIQPGSGGGSRMITTTGEFYCDQRPNEVYELISAALKED